MLARALGRFRNRVVPHILLHVCKAQKQFQQFRPLLGRFCHVPSGKYPNRKIALLNQPIDGLGLQRLSYLTQFQSLRDSGKGIVQVVTQTDSMLSEPGRNRC